MYLKKKNGKKKKKTRSSCCYWINQSECNQLNLKEEKKTNSFFFCRIKNIIFVLLIHLFTIRFNDYIDRARKFQAGVYTAYLRIF